MFRQCARLFVHDRAGVKRRFSLDEHDQALVRCAGVVSRAGGHDEQIAFIEDHRPRFHVDAQAAFQDNEKLVFALVAMPPDRALDFGDLDVALVEFGNDAATNVRSAMRRCRVATRLQA